MLISLDEITKKYDLKIKGIFHIGAHYGQEYNVYIKHGIKNLIFFEPLKNNFNGLLRNIRLTDTIQAYNIALGNFKGEVEMFVETANQGQSSSILKPELHLKQYPQIRFEKKEMVKIDKLDNIVLDHLIILEDFNMINMDVQGYELEVLKGAINTLKHINILYSEVNRDEVYENCVKVEELDKFLMEFGFERIITSWGGDTWGDALYLKR